jgi:hypothetical protein
MTDTVIQTILGYGLLSSLVFTGLLFVQYFLGSERSVRDEEGNFDRRRGGPLALVMLLLMLSLIMGIPVIASSAVLTTMGEPLAFATYFAIGYGIFFFVNLWDLVIIDYILVVRFRPRAIKVPDTAYYNTMKPHVQGWFRGLIIGLVTSLIAALIAMVVL